MARMARKPSAFQCEAVERRVLLSGSAPSELVAVGNRLFFIADDGVHGRELWVSDGTHVGTRLVRDIAPGDADGGVRDLTVFGNLIAFAANDGTHGTELWISDGTAAGTRMIADIKSGGDSGFPTALEAIGDTLFFAAATNQHGRELWKSDGTTAGTVLVKDIYSGSIGSGPFGFTEAGGTIFFSAECTVTSGHGNHTTTTYYGRELWRTDGTSAGTVMVRDIRAGFSDSGPNQLIDLDGALVFSAYTGEFGFEPWRSDGTTAGTQLVQDIDPSFRSSDPRGVREYQGLLYFTAIQNYQRGLWQSDGTAAGTRAAADFAPGFDGFISPAFFEAGPMVFFLGIRPGGGLELWRTDHTAAGTAFVHEILSPHIVQTNPYIQPSAGSAGERLFFTAFDPAIGLELYAVSGTSSPTLLRDIFPGNAQFDPSPQDFIDVNGRLFFTADDGVHGRELWLSDGTTAGTRLVRDIFPSTTPGPIPSRIPIRLPHEDAIFGRGFSDQSIQDLIGESDERLLAS